MVVTSEQIGAAEAAFEKLPLSKKLEAVGALARAERSAAANPYGFPLSSTGRVPSDALLFYRSIHLVLDS